MKKILVANRGEIAIRVMKTAQKMGIKTVAVFSTADRNAPHVRFADEAICIGEPPSNQSYLRGDKIMEVALKLHVDAIHPGYGFLSENADFAELCEKNNIIFIGPKSKSIKMMGDKLAAKEAVKDYNIPMVPGVDRAVTNPNEAAEIASQIGFPILIKAAAGGGGKGMDRECYGCGEKGHFYQGGRANDSTRALDMGAKVLLLGTAMVQHRHGTKVQ